MLNIYACTIPVIKPSMVINTGNIKGAILSNILTIIPPLIMLPKNLMANASVLEISLIILKGNIINVGCKYDLR